MTDYNPDQFLYDLYGSPQYQEDAGMPGDTFSKRASALKSIMSMTGLPLPQLLGGNFTQDQQAPVVNTVGQMYGTNPMYKQAFEAIDSGNDPDTVLKHLIDSGAVDATDQNVVGHVFSTIENYAKENQDNAAKLAAQGQDASYTLSNGKTFKGDPGIMGWSSEHDLLGNPDVRSLMEQYAASRPRVQQQSVPQYGSRHNMVAAPAWSAMAQHTNQAPALNAMQQQMFKGWMQPRIDQSKTNMVRSDANAAAMQSMLALRALIGG